MAILIVDDEDNTREALRTLLTSLGHKTILEARDGREALKVLEAEKTRINMIIADWEMPYMDGLTLLKNVAAIPTYDLAPFLLITSDLPKSVLKSYQEENSRLDGHLLKPFRMKALAEALSLAHKQRVKRRDVIFYVGSKNYQDFADYLKTQDSKKNSPLRWNTAEKITSLAELEKAFERSQRKLGAIFIEPGPETAFMTDWLSSFKKTPLGTHTSVVCLNRDPLGIRPLRTLCQIFTNFEAKADFWKAILRQIEIKTQAGWELELLVPQAKTALQQKNFELAQENATKLLQLDPDNSEIHMLLAEVLEQTGKRLAAVSHYQKALMLNPCSPRPYIRLSELLPADAASERMHLAQTAEQFCPGNGDILKMVSQIRDSK